MATFTSKTLIPGQTPVGQNRDGSYIYEEVMSKATTAPKPITPIYTPPTAIPMVKSPLGFNTVPQVDKQVAQKVNAPVKDTLGLNSKIDSTSERTTQLRSHFSYLEDKGELFLNDKQSDYIKRFKTKYPDYQNVPDAILYGKVILADPKTMEKYGNIGEKTFLQRLGKATFGSLIDTVEATQEGVQAYKDYNVKGGGAMNEGVAIASGLGKFVGDTFTNVGANLINLGVPKKDNLKGATSSSELLGKNVAETLQSVGNFAKTGIDWFKGEGWTENIIQNITESIQSNPEAQKEFQAAMNILNILPGGFANKSAKALTAKQVLKNIARDAELTVGKKGLFGTATKEAFDAGMSRGIVGGIETGVNSTIKASDDWIKKQAEILSRNIPASEQAPSSFEKLKKASAEKIMAKQWKIRPNIRRDIRQKTGMSAEEFALSNNLVGKDIEESLARANAFKDIKMSEKADLISEWGTAPKTPAQDAMAASLKKNLEGSLSDVAGANDPELVSLLKGVDDFINAKETTYQQIDALKSLYDHYNPDNLSWDAQGRLVNPTAHQNAAYRRSQVQKMIEAEGEKRGVDIKQINKDIRGSHDLSKGLAAAEERMANNNIISLGDTQIAIMGSLLGGDIAGVGTLAVKKMLGSESATSFIARKLYNTPNAEINPLNLSGGTRPINRVGRFTGDSGTSPDISSELATPKSVTPVVSGPGQSLAVSIDNGTIDVKKALEQFDKLTPEEKAKAKMASPRLAELVEIDESLKITPQSRFGVEIPEERIVTALKPVIDFIENGKALMDEKQYNEFLGYIEKNMPKGSEGVLGKAFAKSEGIPEVKVETPAPKVEPVKSKETPVVETTQISAPRNYNAIVENIRSNPNGFTLKLDGTPVTEGFAYSPYKGAETILDKDFTFDDFKNFIDKNRDLLEIDGNNVGGWYNKQDGKFYLDVSRIDTDLNSALSNANKNEQIAIYNIGERKEYFTKDYNFSPDGKVTPINEGGATNVSIPKYKKSDIVSGNYNPDEIYKDYTENYMHSDKWRGKSKSIVIDSDSIKKMLLEYDPKNPGLVHEESSNLSKEFFDRAVAENPNAPVIFSAGGPASGKSEGIINGYHGEKNVIFDTVLGDFEAFLRKAKSKIKDGKVKVHAIYTDIDTAKIYNAGRERSVSEKLLKEKHVGFRKAMHDLINSKEYKEGKIAVEVRANKSGTTRNIGAENIEQFIKSHKNTLDIIQ